MLDTILKYNNLITFNYSKYKSFNIPISQQNTMSIIFSNLVCLIISSYEVFSITYGNASDYFPLVTN